MRLTLRTLLAYLDDVLDPQDADELGLKIGQSEFAGGLVHRIRSCISKVRLGAPAVTDTAGMADPNQISEFLDNTMDSMDMPEFERQCLDSEERLAETAACHQILALVLGEPARLSSNMRNKVYHLGVALGGPKTAVTPFQTSETTVKSSGKVQRRIDNPESAEGRFSESPLEESMATTAAKDPLQISHKSNHLPAEKKVKRWPLVLTSITACLATVLILRVIGPLDTGHPLGSMLVNSEVAPELAQNPASQQTDAWLLQSAESKSDRVTSLPTQEAPDKPARGSQWESGEAALPVAAGAQLLENAENVNEFPTASAGPSQLRTSDQLHNTPPVDTAQPTDLANAKGGGDDQKDSQLPDDFALESQDFAETNDVISDGFPEGRDEKIAALPKGVNGIVGSRQGDYVPAEPIPSDSIPRDSITTNFAPLDPASEGSIRGTPVRIVREGADVDGPATNGVEDAVVAQVDLGRFTSEREVMAIWRSQSQKWLRVPQKGMIVSGSLLRVPPAFRPQISLFKGIQVTMVGGTEVVVGIAQDGSTPNLDVHYGGLVLDGLGQAGTEIELTFARRVVSLILDANDTQLALEVRPTCKSGTDPEQPERHHSALIWCLTGQLRLRQGDQSDVMIRSGEEIAFLDESPARLRESSETPVHLMDQQISEIEQSAAAELENRLTEGRSIILSLIEAAENRRTDLRSLASRTLTMFDRYEAIVDALSDPSQRSAWSVHFDQLVQRVGDNSASASRLRRALENRYGPMQAGNLYRMLWGYSEEDLSPQGVAAAQLVDYLDHDQLEFRVLSIENLRRITGATLTYQAKYTANRRRSSVARWRRRLEAGQIIYKNPPANLTEEFLNVPKSL